MHARQGVETKQCRCACTHLSPCMFVHVWHLCVCSCVWVSVCLRPFCLTPAHRRAVPGAFGPPCSSMRRASLQEQRGGGGLRSAVESRNDVQTHDAAPPSHRNHSPMARRWRGGRAGAAGTPCASPDTHGTGGGGGGWAWLALLACGGAYWPLALEPSAMTSRHLHYCGHPHCRGHPGWESRMQFLPTQPAKRPPTWCIRVRHLLWWVWAASGMCRGPQWSMPRQVWARFPPFRSSPCKSRIVVVLGNLLAANALHRHCPRGFPTPPPLWGPRLGSDDVV